MFKVGDILEYNIESHDFWDKSHNVIEKVMTNRADESNFYKTKCLKDKGEYIWSEKDLTGILNAKLVNKKTKAHLPKWW